MSKKNYIVIGITILIFILVIITILTSKKETINWLNEIKNSDSYTVSMEDCNERKVTLSNDVIDKLESMWNNLSNKGPWTQDDSVCYSKINISFEKNQIIKEEEILLIDDDSLVLNIDNNSIQYSNSGKINSYLMDKFKTTSE